MEPRLGLLAAIVVGRASRSIVGYQALGMRGVSYHDPEGPSFLRHSARAVAELGASKGYWAIARTGLNMILMHLCRMQHTRWRIAHMPRGGPDGLWAPSRLAIVVRPVYQLAPC
jgi:hypothetical protein